MERIGRFLVIEARDGLRHAVSATAVAAICEDPDGATVLLLPGGKHIVTDVPLQVLAAALSASSRPAPLAEDQPMSTAQAEASCMSPGAA